MAVLFEDIPATLKEQMLLVPDVPVHKIFVPERGEPDGYARPANKARVKKLTEEFDPQAVGVLYLSFRHKEDKYALIDGHHRLEAIIANGIDTVSAQVFIDLTIEQEARLYRQFGDYLRQTAVDRYLAARMEGDPDTLAMDRMLANFGLSVTSNGAPQSGSIQAVAMLQRVAETLGTDVLRETLRFLHDAFGTDMRAYTSNAINGTAQFAIRFFKHPKFRRTNFIGRLQEIGVTGVIRQAHDIAAAERTAGGNAWGMALVKIHDYKREQANRLGAWPVQVYTEKGKEQARKNLIEKALPASINAKKIAAAKRAQADADCPKCNAQPGWKCTYPNGEPLTSQVHNERYARHKELAKAAAYARDAAKRRKRKQDVSAP
jgi:hypothetical protein